MALSLVDDRGKPLDFEREPARVVSLVPSDTYTLLRLGVRPLARTVYCVEPAAEVADIETVGGTKNADVERIVALSPDLVIANQEENRRVDIERLEEAGIRVLLSFPQTVSQGIAHAERLLSLYPSRSGAGEQIDAAWSRYQALSRRKVTPVATFVPIWMDPLMTVHQSTFISDALELAGGANVFADRRRRYPLAADLGRREPLPASEIGERDLRYPRVTLEEVVLRRPELVLLPDEPHEFTEADAEVFRALDLPRVVFCNGKDLMWYGLRAVEGLERLEKIIAG
jgi:ABC-type Fe3+-hydroxamate transport system substrate-binding protein